MESLHPQSDPLIPDPVLFQYINFSSLQVSTALASFPRGSSAGPFGLSAGAISRMAADSQMGQSVLDSLALFCGNFVSGRFPTIISPFYGCARLIPLPS